uniref:Uncharacterized protein n=1 Tax=Anguilla anguilla TaxID=7936 RepID=A0A0E9WW23_ANGAN
MATSSTSKISFAFGGILESGWPFLPYAHSGSISSLDVSPLLIVRRASSHPLITLPSPTLKDSGLVCFFFLAVKGMLVSKTVPSSSDPVYQQLTVSPFLGKLALSPFFSTDLVYLGGPSSTGTTLASFGFSSTFTSLTCSVRSSTGSVPLNFLLSKS